MYSMDDTLETAQNAAAVEAYRLTNRGTERLAAGQVHDALLDFDRAVELAPFDALVLGLRGEALLGNRNLEAALEDFERAIELLRADDWPCGEYRLAKAAILMELGDCPGAAHLAKETARELFLLAQVPRDEYGDFYVFGNFFFSPEHVCRIWNRLQDLLMELSLHGISCPATSEHLAYVGVLLRDKGLWP
jgi:tetratricopeptide (TPR) repeat protein